MAGNPEMKGTALEPGLAARLRNFYFLPSRERGGHFLPLIIGIMVFLACLGAATGLAIYNATSAWSSDLAQTMTVQIVHPGETERARQAREVIRVLSDTPGVEQAREMSRREISALLEPWLGVGNVTEDLPVPAMIAVTVRPGAHIDTVALNARLKEAAPDASLDDHQQWIGQLVSLSAMVQGAVFVSILLIMLTTVAIVIFATKSALAAHRETVEIVHLIGARDGLISGEFRKLFMWHGLKGGVLGLALAAVTLGLFLYLANRLGGGLLPQLSLTGGQWLFLAALPFLTAVLTMLTADMTVRKSLLRMV